MKTLKERQISCLFLMDRHQHWYHSGILGFADSIPSIAEVIAGYQAKHQTTYAMGHSMGGYAALLFSAICSLNGCIATAPQTSITQQHRLQWGDRRWGQKIPEARDRSPTPQYFDLRETLAASASRHLIFYTEAHKVDEKHALHVGDLPSVTLCGVEGHDYNTAKALRNSGALGEMLDLVAVGGLLQGP